MFRLLVCDLLTDQVIDRFEVDSLTFDEHIGKIGSLSGTLPITDADMGHRVRTAMIPGRTALYVERGRSIWWGGILWATSLDSDQDGRIRLSFQGATFESYLAHRISYVDWVFIQFEQLDIVRHWLDYVQTDPAGNLGIVAQQTVSGVQRDRTYSRHDMHVVYDLIDNLSKVDNGFEWRIRAYLNTAGERVKELQFGYPKFQVGAEDVVLTRPGPILSYSISDDATSRANHWKSRGASETDEETGDSVPITSPLYYLPDAEAEGWPRLDGTSDYTTVEEQDTLNQHAIADLVRSWTEHTVTSVTVSLDGTITPSLIGAVIFVRIHDAWFSDGMHARYRVIGMKVSAPSRSHLGSAELFLETA